MDVREVAYEVEGWGLGRLYFADSRLIHHDLPEPALTGAEPTDEPLVARVLAYFDGARVDFAEVELELDWCTPFQHAVADALRAVPYGETVTYGELAALAGRPNAHRAAGTFCARNRFPLVLPCHRVVAADGLGPYGSHGTGYKRRLLALEGAA